MINSILNDIDPDNQYFDQFNNTMESGTQSNYLSPAEYRALCLNDCSLKILSYNIRSYRANSDSFFALFDQKLPDVMILVETWFKPDFKVDIPSYQSFHITRGLDGESSRSGGVSIYVHDSISCTLIDNLSFANETIEICSVKINYSSVEIFILGIYRPHSDSISNFCDGLSELICENIPNNKLCTILGDFNINILDQSNYIKNFVLSMNSSHFLPCILKPTRFSLSNSGEPTLLDHVWLNSLKYTFHSGIISHDSTDHCPIFINLNINPIPTSKTEKVKIVFRCVNESNRILFSNKLSEFDWYSLYVSDVDTFVSNFIDKLNDLYCNSFPLMSKYIVPNKNANPWITRNIRLLINHKSEYFSLFRMGLVTRAENNIYKNKVKSIIDRAKKSYYNNAFHSAGNNLRLTWKLIKSLISVGSSNKKLKSIFWNNMEFNSDLDIAEAFNNYFCNVAQDLESKLPSSSNDPLNYLGPRNNFSLFLTPVTPTECSKIIRTLKKVKQDKSNLPVNLFIENHSYYLHVICDMVNQCFSSAKFPSPLKIATTVPIFKKGDVHSIENYRPISILPYLSKIFEKVINSRILNFMSLHNLISPVQFGFVKGRSTEDAILNLTDKIYNSLNLKYHTINIFIDFSKAFDTIKHDILFRKLDHYGIRGLPLQLITSYLENRRQKVRVNNCFSSLCSIDLGVPQGSVLGPLLFILYINDLPILSSNSQTTLYADDATFTFTGNNIESLVSLCNHDLTRFYGWAIDNRLTINVSKTNYMLTSNIPINDSDTINVLLNNQSLSRKNNVLYLGMVLDDKLKFNEHTKRISTKISKSVGIINRIKNIVPFPVLKNLYYTLIYPYLYYCLLIWGSSYQQHLNSLWLLQKRAIRIINLKPFRHPTSQLFFQSKILKLPDIYLLKLGLYMYENKENPIFIRYHDHQTRSHTLLYPVFSRLTSTQQSVFYSGPVRWNNIPLTIKNSRSLSIFKNHYRNYLMIPYENEV